jgi:hypothetical protein
MEVVLKIQNAGKELASLLGEEGYKASFVKGGVIVRLTKNNKKYYTIPEKLRKKNHLVIVNLKETCKKNFAQIVCRSDGRALVPFFIKNKEPHFGIKKNAMVICAFKKEFGAIEISITNINVIFSKEKIFINKELIFIGNEDVPDSLKRFRRAVLIAIEKTKCNRNKQPFYIQRMN